jgi:hypothetical protein
LGTTPANNLPLQVIKIAVPYAMALCNETLETKTNPNLVFFFLHFIMSI